MNSPYKRQTRPWAMALLPLLLMMAFFLPQIAFAQGGSGASGSQFQFANNDYFINVILRGVLGDIINVGASNAQQTVTGSGTLGEVFRTMNLGIAFFGSMIVIFITVVGILQSGNDGEFLGRKWSSMWVPVRFATGSALMLPLTASGYSYCQALVIWIAAQGVGFADTLWNSIVQNIVVKNGSQISATYDTKRILTNIATFEACVKAVNLANNGTTSWGRIGPVVSTFTNESGQEMKQVSYFWGNPDSGFLGLDPSNQRTACGELKYAYPDTAAYEDPYKNIRVAVDTFNRQAIEKYSNVYASEFQAIVTEIQKEDGTSNPVPLIKVFLERIPTDIAMFNEELAQEGTDAFAASGYDTASQSAMTEYGFAMAGMWYMEVLRAHNTLRQSFAAPEGSPVQLSMLDSSIQQKVSDTLGIVQNQFAAAEKGGGNAAQNQINKSSSGGTATAPVKTTVTSFNVTSDDFTDAGFVNTMFARAANYMRGVMFGVGAAGAGSGGTSAYSSWNFQGSSSSNPNVSAILQLKNKGDAILDVAGVLISTDIGARVIVGSLKADSLWSQAASVVTDVIPTAVAGKIGASITSELSTYIVGAAFALFVFGLTLSVLIPMMPYILWIGAILGLVVLIMESLVAIMLWAVMMMHPSGEGITSQYNERGLQMLLAVFMRPALLLMGYVIGMFMLEPMVGFVNDTFSLMVSSVQTITFTGFFSFIAFIGIYCSMILMVVEKSFAMIHTLADRVLTWIGGPGALTGEEGEAKGRSDQMLRAGSQAMNTAMLSRRNEKSHAKAAAKSAAAKANG